MLKLNTNTKVIGKDGTQTTTDSWDELLYLSTENYLKKKQTRFDDYAKWIKEDVENNINKGVGLNEQSVAPLKESTIKRKGSSRLFVDKGLLMKGIQISKEGNESYKIFDSSNHGVAVQQGLGKGNTPRKFFGISEKIKERILSDLKKGNQ